MMMAVMAIVAGLALVQSLFGIGLLVFGTPTLLLLGYSFPSTLAILLPASIAISVLQVARSGGQDAVFVRQFAVWCLVPLVVTLGLVLALGLRPILDAGVALLLVLFVVMRMAPGLGGAATAWAGRHDRAWLAAMGLVHGFSNLGGAMLLVFATARHRHKEEVRALIAFCYACFAASQLAVLAFFAPHEFGWSQAASSAIAATVFVAVGQPTFQRVPGRAFETLLTAVAGAYACLLGLRVAGML